MSDQATAPAPEVAPEPAAAPAAAPPAASSTPPASISPAAPETPSEKPVASDWPDDWRDKFAAKAKPEDREKLSKRLARFASPDNVLSSYLDLDRKMSAGEIKPSALTENATPEEAAAFRKAWSVPEKPEEYALAFPESMKDSIGEADKAELNEFMATAHKMNTPAPIAKGLADWYFAQREKAVQQEYDQAIEKTVNYKSEIKAEFGKDYNRNITMAKAELASVITAERAGKLTDITLSDGTKLGDHPEFVRYVVASALKGADETALVNSDLTSAGKSFDEAYREAINLKFTDPKAYHSEGHQKKLQTLAAAKAKQKAA